MGSFRVLSQRTGRMATLAALVVATLGQGLLPALASADAVTARSIALTSSTANTTGVSYKVGFTATTAAGAYVVEFCDSPLIPSTCNAPSGFDASNAALGADGTTATAVAATTNKLVVTNTISAAEAVTDTFTTIKNPTTAGTVYARIVTYDTEPHASSEYTSTALGNDAKDQGGVAIAITNDVNVSGVVNESMTFCAAKVSITADCANAAANPPSIKLANANGALDTQDVYTGDVYTQISTNASGGAIVSVKSDANACGGLHRIGDAYDVNHCFIKPTDGTHPVAAGTPYFGIKTSADDTDATNGTFQAANGYNASSYKLNFDSVNPTAPTSGVTSTYGDEILNTNNAPANNRNMTLTFGASVSNNTPAGTYQAKLSLIATGTF